MDISIKKKITFDILHSNEQFRYILFYRSIALSKINLLVIYIHLHKTFRIKYRMFMISFKCTNVENSTQIKIK